MLKNCWTLYYFKQQYYQTDNRFLQCVSLFDQIDAEKLSLSASLFMLI